MLSATLMDVGWWSYAAFEPLCFISEPYFTQQEMLQFSPFQIFKGTSVRGESSKCMKNFVGTFKVTV